MHTWIQVCLYEMSVLQRYMHRKCLAELFAHQIDIAL